jgi:hypothetical protein
MEATVPEITYGQIMRSFAEQFPGLKINDMRPNGPYQIYVWICDSPTNIIATFNPDSKTFIIVTTYKAWGLL